MNHMEVLFSLAEPHNQNILVVNHRRITWQFGIRFVYLTYHVGSVHGKQTSVSYWEDTKKGMKCLQRIVVKDGEIARYLDAVLREASA